MTNLWPVVAAINAMKCRIDGSEVKLRMCQTHKAADVVGLYMAPPEIAIMRAPAPRGRSGKPSALMLAQ